MNGDIIENVQLVEINRKTNSQHYKWGIGLYDSMWLTGNDRASDVKVGMMGKLVKVAGEHYHLYKFVPYEIQGVSK